MELRRAEHELDTLLSSYSAICQGCRDLLSSTATHNYSANHEDTNVMMDLLYLDDDDNDDDKQTNDNANASTVPGSMIELHGCLIQLIEDLENVHESGLLEKFRRRSKESDPITGKPRYGKKAMDRVLALLEKHAELWNKIELIRSNEKGVDVGVCSVSQLSLEESSTGGTVLSLFDLIKVWSDKEKRDNEIAVQIQMSDEEKTRRERETAQQQEEFKRKMEEEARLREQVEKDNKAEQERRAKVKRDEIEKRKKEEEEKRRQEEEKRIIDAIVRGKEGVQIQLNRLKESCGNDRAAFRVALRSLHILFSQILSRPEELRFRLIRSNHPQFEDDIGRWLGGREVLIAAGFQIIEIEKITCYVTKEPSLETDMDAWSGWFDGLKSTIQAIEDEMNKI